MREDVRSKDSKDNIHIRRSWAIFCCRSSVIVTRSIYNLIEFMISLEGRIKFGKKYAVNYEFVNKRKKRGASLVESSDGYVPWTGTNK